MLPVFAANEIFFVFNRKRLDRNFKNKDVMSVKRIDLIHYLLKVMSVIWPFFGLLGPAWHIFLGIVGLWILKFVIYHVFTRFYRYYIFVVPILNAVAFMTAFFLTR